MRIIKGIVLGTLMVLPTAGFSDAVTNVSWKSSISLGATYKQGNTDKTLYTMNLKGDRAAPKSNWVNSLYGEYGKTEGEQTEGQVRGQSNYRYKFGTEDFFGGIFSEAYHDDIKDVRFRAKIGPNVGYYFINKKAMKLDTSVGLNYVYQRTANGESQYEEWRVAGNYLWNISETASYYLNAEYSAKVDNPNDGTGLLTTGVKSKLNTKLSMFVEVRDEYDNIPDGDDVEYNDLTITAGLTYDLL